MADSLDSPQPIGQDPSLIPQNPFGDSLHEFELRRQELDQSAAQALESFGPEVIEAYGSVRIYHNTLHTLLPTILEEGLRADSPLATPDAGDIDFAEQLFRTKGQHDSNTERQFDKLVRGVRDQREPGVYFYGTPGSKADDYNTGYGRPERLFIFTQEMGCIMLDESGNYSSDERARARELFEKYLPSVNGDGFISVVEANPFSPPIFNQRLAGLPDIEPDMKDILLNALTSNSVMPFEGIYVSESVPPTDIRVAAEQIPIKYPLSEASLLGFRSRYF